MRIFLLSTFIFLFNTSFSQVHKYWIYDTAHVKCFYATYAVIPDTIANFKKDTITKGKIAIYWDREFNNLYTERDLSHPALPAITWYRNGQMDERIINHVIDGSKENDWGFSGWYPDGKKKSETVYSGKTRKMIYYFNNGQLKRFQVSKQGVRKDKPDWFEFIYEEERCDNGQLIFKDSVNTYSTRKFVRYYCSGKKEREFMRNDANEFGKYTEWYENGQIKVDGQYDETVAKEKIFTFGASKEQGSWKYYNETGKLTKEETYKDGVVIDTKNY